MISEYTKNDTSKILYVINDASLRYKSIIPDNCWHEPYMSEQELFDECSSIRESNHTNLMKRGRELEKNLHDSIMGILRNS